MSQSLGTPADGSDEHTRLASFKNIQAALALVPEIQQAITAEEVRILKNRQSTHEGAMGQLPS